MAEIVTYIATALLGSGLTTLVFKWWVQTTLERAQKKKDEETAAQRRRYELADARDHATSRVLFWIDHGLKNFEAETGKKYWNGDLATAFEKLNAADDAIKTFDREQLAKLNTK